MYEQSRQPTNLVVGNDLGFWAIYRLGAGSAAMPEGDLPTEFSLSALLELLDIDFTLLRVRRPWSAAEYEIGYEAAADLVHAQRHMLRAYVDAQRGALEALGPLTTEMFLGVRLREGSGGEDFVGPGWPLDEEARTFESLRGCGGVARVSETDMERLWRHAHRRGLGRAPVDELAVRDGDWPPPMRIGSSLRVGSEPSASYQAFLRVDVPVRAGVLGELFERVDAATCAVDVSVVTTVVAPPGIGGPRRHEIAGGPQAFPRVAVSLAIGAGSAATLERRVVSLRRDLAGLRLARVGAEQLELFEHHLPRPAGQRRILGAHVTAADLGSVAPAVSAIGTRSGPYIGYTLRGAPRPVLLDPFKATGERKSSSILLAGEARSGKTLGLELIAYQALVAGATVIDLDMRGDHALERLPDVATRASVTELAAMGRYRGLLDPMRVAPEDMVEMLTCRFLGLLCPVPMTADHRKALLGAIRAARSRGAVGCGAVTRALARGGPELRTLAAAIEQRARSGPAVLAFGDGDGDGEAGGVPPSQYTCLRIRDTGLAGALGLGPARTGPSELGRLLFALLVLHAASLLGSEPGRPSIISLDEVAPLCGDPLGRLVLTRLLEAGADRVTVLALTSAAADARWLADRSGIVLCLRAGSDRELRAARDMLGVGEADHALLRALRDARPGRGVMRDAEGRIAAVQIEFVHDGLLSTLDTTPAGPIWG